jgi:hypothetical protein
LLIFAQIRDLLTCTEKIIVSKKRVRQVVPADGNALQTGRGIGWQIQAGGYSDKQLPEFVIQ